MAGFDDIEGSCTPRQRHPAFVYLSPAEYVGRQSSQTTAA